MTSTNYEVRCYDANYGLLDTLPDDNAKDAGDTFERLRNSCPGFMFIELIEVRSRARQVLRRFERHAD